MIKADKKKWAEFIFYPYEEFLLKRNFSGFYLTGTPPVINNDKALVITPNHFSWWDGFFIDYTIRKLCRKDFYILMLEEQLRKYRFFSKVGAFSIHPEKLGSIKETLLYSGSLLNNHNNVLVYYPQGRIEAYDKSSLTIQRGLFHMLKDKPGIDILPAAFRIEYDNLKNPFIYLRFGTMLNSQEISDNPDLFKNKFKENLDELNRSAADRIRTLNLFTGRK